ncbi:MAG: transposase, partial [Pseudomonadota bacterium]|nr:transposase [Pseudomonadota bacterium]
MALGKRKPVQQPLFVSTADLNARPHPFYAAVNQVLDAHHFDVFAEDLCAKFYDDGTRGGRPGLAPGVYFRCLLVGYFEGIDSERGIDWRCNDSLSLKAFLGVALDAPAPDHSTISRTRRLVELETHAEVFQFLLKVLANHGLVDGKTVGVDSTTLEANAAMRSIIRRDTGEGYQEFLTRLAKESGIETPTREDLARLDKKRKNKASNDDWQSPDDPDAKITKMKDGTTHLAHKAEHAVDMGENGHGAILAVNVCDAAAGDTATLTDTVVASTENLRSVADDERVSDKISGDFMSEAVLDKGYHSKQTLLDLDEMDIRSYASEPARGRQQWDGQHEARDAVYANRRRVKGERGRRLLRSRGEKLERTFAHCYETGAMRRLHLRGRDNVAKRVLIHAAAFNIGLMMRVRYGLRKPRSLSKAAAAARALVFGLVERLRWIR